MSKYVNVNKVGNMALEVRKRIYETVAASTLFDNIDTWSNIMENELNTLEKMQYRILRGMYEQPQGTPSWGIMADSVIWSVAYRVEHKKIMLLHNMLNSEEKRLTRDTRRSTKSPVWTVLGKKA